MGNPFPVGDGPKTFTIPSGANQLLLGVDDNDYADNTGSWQIKVTYAPAAGSTTGNPSCYQFSGPDATLEIDITSFAVKQDDKATSAGYTSRDTYEGNNSLMLGGATKTSISTSNTPDCVGCLLGSAVFSYSSGTDLTIFTMTVPADDTPGDMNSWFVTLGGPGNLIPSGVLPSSQLFPPISVLARECADHGGQWREHRQLPGHLDYQLLSGRQSTQLHRKRDRQRRKFCQRRDRAG